MRNRNTWKKRRKERKNLVKKNGRDTDNEGRNE